MDVQKDEEEGCEVEKLLYKECSWSSYSVDVSTHATDAHEQTL